MKKRIQISGAAKQKGVLVLGMALGFCGLILTGCSGVKVRDCSGDLASRDVEIRQLREVVSFEEALVEDSQRELEALKKKVKVFLDHPHTCKHKGLLK